MLISLLQTMPQRLCACRWMGRDRRSPDGQSVCLQRLFHARDDAGTEPDHAQEKAPERGLKQRSLRQALQELGEVWILIGQAITSPARDHFTVAPKWSIFNQLALVKIIRVIANDSDVTRVGLHRVDGSTSHVDRNNLSCDSKGLSALQNDSLLTVIKADIGPLIALLRSLFRSFAVVNTVPPFLFISLDIKHRHRRTPICITTCHSNTKFHDIVSY
ncbi:hypothetical protein [Denitratimonas sp. CY0512]|uniref:hypothetical protein n=1 Tax=Denitratimonas sp. CY0512 TaxID=3131940 RepID=UPI003097C683